MEDSRKPCDDTQTTSGRCCKGYFVLFVVLLILNSCTTTGGQPLCNLHTIKDINISNEQISPPKQESFKTQLSSPLDTTTEKYDHCSPVPSNHHSASYDRPQLEKPILQSVQAAIMCPLSETQVCPLVKNPPLEYCGSSNKTSSQGHNELTQSSVCLPNMMLNASVAEKPEFLWFYPVYYLFLMIVQYMYNSSIGVRLLLIFLLCLSCILAAKSSNGTNNSPPRNNSATRLSLPEPPVDNTPEDSPSNSSTAIQGESSDSEFELDSEVDNNSEVWEEPIACSDEGGPTDVAGIQNLYLVNQVVKMEGRRCENNENQPSIASSLRSFQQSENEEPIGLQLAEEDNVLLQLDHPTTTEGVSNVLGPLPVVGCAAIAY